MRSPKGGIVIGLHFYPGGRFIPDQALRADPAAGQKLAAAGAAESYDPATLLRRVIAAGLAHLPADRQEAARLAWDRIRQAKGAGAAQHVLGLLRNDLAQLAHGVAADEAGRDVRLRVAAECWMLDQAMRPAPENGVALAQRRAPKGGTMVGGKPYPGGEFLPLFGGEKGGGTAVAERPRTPKPAAPPAAERLSPDQLFNRHPELHAILAPVKDASDNATEQDVLDRAIWAAENQLTDQHQQALRAAGFGLGDGLDLERAAGAAHYHAGLYDRAHLGELAAIPVNEARRVGGVLVRRQGPDRYRVETERGHVTGDAKKVAEHIASIRKGAHLHGRQLQAALDRAAGYEEPTFLEADRLDAAARAFERLPAGTHVVSLDSDAGTYGRTGRIVRDEAGHNRVTLDGEAGYASAHVEPLDSRLSWRQAPARPTAEAGEAADPPRPAARQGFLFSLWRRLARA